MGAQGCTHDSFCNHYRARKGRDMEIVTYGSELGVKKG